MSGSLEAFNGFDSANSGELEAAVADLDHTADFSGSNGRFAMPEDIQGRITLPGLTDGIAPAQLTAAIFRAVEAQERGDY